MCKSFLNATKIVAGFCETNYSARGTDAYETTVRRALTAKTRPIRSLQPVPFRSIISAGHRLAPSIRTGAEATQPIPLLVAASESQFVPCLGSSLGLMYLSSQGPVLLSCTTVHQQNCE